MSRVAIVKTVTHKFKKVKIPVSNIAPLIGYDHYSNFPKILCEIWRKYDRDTFNELEKLMQSQNIDIATDSEARRIVRSDSKNGTNFMEQIKKINSQTSTSEHLQKKQKIVIDQILKTDSLAKEDQDNLIKQIVSTTNKYHGINNEATVLKKYEAQTGQTIKNGQESIFYTFYKDDDIGIEWELHGKYDGLTECGRLIEAKKRQKGLFKTLRDYEKVQLQTYLHMKGVEKGSLVESYSTEGECHMHIIDVDYDKKYVEEFIIGRLKSFAKFFHDFISNESWRKEILLGDKKREIYTMYQKIYINGL
jgi:hypothetical protein